MISIKVAFTIMILMVIAGTGVLALVTDAESRREQLEFVDRSVESLQSISLAVGPAVANERYDRVQAVFDNLASQPGGFSTHLRSLELIGRDGRIIADLDPRKFNLRKPMPVLHTQERVRINRIVRDGVHELQIFVPVRGTYVLGMLIATLGSEALSGSFARQRTQAAWYVMATATVLAIALYLVLQQIVGRRVISLAEVAHRLRSGNLQARAPVDGDDEIAELASVFNEMAAVIQTNTDQLEHQIAERTASLQQANERLEQLAMTDPLTTLFNRRHFEERAARDLEVAKRAQRPFSLLVLDVDEFKQVNDRFGHLVGDRVLQGVGRVLLESARAMDLSARIGGEEFTVAMPDATAQDAIAAAERIRERIASPGPFDLLALHGEKVTISVGVASFPQHGNSLQELFSAADTALYRAKQSGRNKVVEAA